jgi:hypothetical protein
MRSVLADHRGEEVIGIYYVEGDVLHVSCPAGSTSAPLRRSKPDVLAHVLLNALIEELHARGIDPNASEVALPP